MFSYRYGVLIKTGCSCQRGLLVFVMAAAMFAQAQNRPPVFNPPKRYYLALGDSISYGFQAFKFHAGLPPSGYNTGYVDVFGALLRQIQPGITTVNYGCPGESTESFITGPCIWTAAGNQLHDTFSGSQLEAALTFLRAHSGQVGPITFTLWGNDLPKLLAPCTFNGQIDPVCVRNNAPGFARSFEARVSDILSQVRAAAPDAEIVVLGAWDSYIDVLAFADPLFQTLNASLARAAVDNGARFADPFPAFNPQGDVTAEVNAVCAMTLLCTDRDSHPSDAGYRTLAALVWDASEYFRLRN